MYIICCLPSWWSGSWAWYDMLLVYANVQWTWGQLLNMKYWGTEDQTWLLPLEVIFSIGFNFKVSWELRFVHVYKSQTWAHLGWKEECELCWWTTEVIRNAQTIFDLVNLMPNLKAWITVANYAKLLSSEPYSEPWSMTTSLVIDVDLVLFLCQ